MSTRSLQHWSPEIVGFRTTLFRGSQLVAARRKSSAMRLLGILLFYAKDTGFVVIDNHFYACLRTLPRHSEHPMVVGRECPCRALMENIKPTNRKTLGIG